MSAAKGGVKSDINVTPLVDVMLVLLIIMMIVAPLLQKGADVKLPLAAEHGGEAGDAGSDGRRSRQDRSVLRQRPARCRKEELRQKVEEILETRKERIILIKADEDARYSAVMDAMDELRASGIEDMGLITDPKNRTGLLGGGGRQVMAGHRAHQHLGADRVVQAKELHPSSDMNITPMIDVLLVLLVIFMAALPLSQRGLTSTCRPRPKPRSRRRSTSRRS
jgi:biopolymer transport protein ExbD